MKQLGKLDKYHAHLVDGAKLKPDELDMLAKYRKATACFAWVLAATK
jgi:hypothetical protein